MKVKFIRPCLAKGQHYAPDQIAEFDVDTANALIAHRRAVPFNGEEVVNADPRVETRDPVVVDNRPRRKNAKT